MTLFASIRLYVGGLTVAFLKIVKTSSVWLQPFLNFLSCFAILTRCPFSYFDLYFVVLTANDIKIGSCFLKTL